MSGGSATDPCTSPRSALVVLCAGRSSRMGRCKALLPFGDRTALGIALSNAASAGVQQVVAVIGADADDIREAHRDIDGASTPEWAINPEPGSPMLASLCCGLRVLRERELDVFLFQPVDLPLILAEDFRRLLRAFAGRSGGETVFVPSHARRRGHPVLCEASLLESFLALPVDASPRSVIESQRVVHVETPNAGVLEDMDRPCDYERLREAYEERLLRGGGAAPGDEQR